MKTKVEYETSEFPGYTLYFFYVQKKVGKEWCWIWDEDRLLEVDALKKYPKNKYDWVLYAE
jgi:hypothetical protein